MEFFNVLTGPELLELTEAHLPEHRERLYPPTVTLAMFVRQALAADPSCQRAVDGWAASRAAEGLSPQSVRTGGYCRARARLPLPMLQALTRETGQQLSARTPAAWAFRLRGSRRCASPLRRSKRASNSTRTVRGCILTWCWPR